jgi:hypothetical protein
MNRSEIVWYSSVVSSVGVVGLGPELSGALGLGSSDSGVMPLKAARVVESWRLVKAGVTRARKLTAATDRPTTRELEEARTARAERRATLSIFKRVIV